MAKRRNHFEEFDDLDRGDLIYIEPAGCLSVRGYFRHFQKFGDGSYSLIVVDFVDGQTIPIPTRGIVAMFVVERRKRKERNTDG